MGTKPHPLIFMVKPPPAIAQLADELRIRLEMPRRYSIDRLHITLMRVGDTFNRSEDDIAEMKRLAAGIDHPPFRVSFDMVGGKVLLGSDKMRGAVSFQRKLAGAMSRYRDESRGAFRPHISLHYDSAPLYDCPIDALSWRVDEFLLVESVQGEGRHELLGRFPLAA